MFIDTHFHLGIDGQKSSDQYIQQSKAAGVHGFIVSACDLSAMKASKVIMEQYSELYFSFGFHPEEVERVTEEDLKFLETELKNCSKIVAVGEIGLDYYWDKDHKSEQRTLFRSQLALAQKYHLPVVIHSREAIQETYDILKEYSVRGVIHCFSGSLEMAKMFIDLGYLLGIGGVVTFRNSHLREVVEKIPLASIVLETDSPYLAPDPYRGQENSSEYIPIIARMIAEIKKVSVEEVARVTTANATQLFDLPQ